MTARFLSCTLLAALLLCALPAKAHITLEAREAKVGAPFKAVFRVPHGCEASATVKLRVRIPAGMIAVKPMPKPGWQLDLVTSRYDKPYDYFHGARLSEGVSEVSWTGNLPDRYYDEFVLTGFIAGDLKPGTMLYFPVVQECEQGVHRWIEIPANGRPGDRLKEPAPAVLLVPGK